MAIGAITIADRFAMGDGAQYFKCSFAGDGAYPAGGTLGADVLTALKLAIKTAELAASDTNVRAPENPAIVAIVPGDCGQYVPCWVGGKLKVLDGGDATRTEAAGDLSGTTFSLAFITQ